MHTVLVIDDDMLIRAAIRHMIEGDGYAVYEAENGDQGVRMYRQSPCDVVLTDMVMPDKEGMQVIRELRKEFPGVRIIAMTSGGRGSQTDYLKWASMLGAARTFAKPIRREELLAALADVLGN